MSKTLNWDDTYVSRPPAPGLRRAAAALLRAGSRALARAARRLRRPAPGRPLHLAVIEFHPLHNEAGAPEGALYVDGELVGTIRGVTRL